MASRIGNWLYDGTCLPEMTPVSSSSVLPAAEASVAEATAVQEVLPGRVSLAGVTARWISDYRMLFKDRVTALVVMTAWAGFYLGSMQSGISSVQPGLLEALLGIGVVSAGSAALNECLERKQDRKMLRTANRPLASGRMSLAHGIIAGLGAIILGSVWLALTTNLITGTLTLITAFTYVAIYTPLKRRTTLA